MNFESLDFRTVLAILAGVLAVLTYTRYLRSILKREFKPHMFSWGVWSLAVLAYKYGDKNYTRSDWIALISALSAIPLWLLTNDPLWSVILITMIDIIAFYPTIRKSWIDPRYESTGMFFLSGLICALGIAGLTVINFTTSLYVFALVILNWGFVLMLYARRGIVKPA